MIVISKETASLLSSAGIKSEDLMLVSNREEIKKIIPEKEDVFVLTKDELKKFLEDFAEVMKEGKFGILLITDEKNPEAEKIADAFIPTNFDHEILTKTIRKIITEKKKEAEENRLLSESIEYMELLSVYRRGMKIVGIVEQDVCHEILKALLEETHADSGAVWIKRGETYKAVEAKGEIDPNIFHLYLKEEELKAGKPIKIEEGTFLSPFVVDDGIEGTAILLKKKGFTERDVKVLNILSKFSAIALRNWRKISEYMDKTLRTEFKMYTPIFFSEYIEKEINKARRYRREFSLVYILINNFASIKRNFSESVINEHLERMLRLIAGSIRSVDVFSKLSESEYLILLPETEYVGSWMTRLRIESMFKGKLYIIEGKKTFPITLILSSATYPHDGLTYGALLEVLKTRASFENTPVYQKIFSSSKEDIFSFLLSDEGKKEVEEVEKEITLFRDLVISLEDFKKILFLFTEDLLKERKEKSILFIKTSHPELSGYLEELKTALAQTNTRFYHVKEDEKFLFFYIRGAAGYCAVGKIDEKHTIKGIHSDSLLLTENLLKKIVEEEKIELS